MRAQRHSHGSVRFDRRRRTWNYLWYETGKRRSKLIGTRQDFPTKASAWAEVERLAVVKPKTSSGETMRGLIARYMAEKMPARHSTAYVYKSFLKNHIIPRWGDTLVRDIAPRPVELWLRELKLSPKSKTHVRSLMHSLLEFAMFSGALEIGRNPRLLGAKFRRNEARPEGSGLNGGAVGALLKELHEPFATMALVSISLGLRISETLALRWADIDFLRSRITINRGIVMQEVDDCKTLRVGQDLRLGE